MSQSESEIILLQSSLLVYHLSSTPNTCIDIILSILSNAGR